MFFVRIDPPAFHCSPRLHVRACRRLGDEFIIIAFINRDVMFDGMIRQTQTAGWDRVIAVKCRSGQVTM